MTDERTFVADHVDDLHADLDTWLRIPSISADPARAGDVRRNAEWLVAALRRTGFPTVEIWETPGAPAVFAEWPADEPGATAVTVYGHHDVQPVDPEELWERPPFEPTIVGDELFARGASDDKGQLLFHLLGLRAHLAATGRTSPAVHLKFLVEGEEESGSPHFAALLRERRDRLACDVVVVTDTGMFGRDTPSICTGMRGLADGEIHLHGPDVDLHSGSFGGAVPNPLTVMARLLAALHDDNGVVQLPGFYDDVVPLTARERESFAALPFDEQEFVHGPAQSRATAGEAGYSTLERIWGRPTAEVNGMWGGYTGPGHKTIVPSDAYAKVSFRLVVDQDPEKVQLALAEFVQAHVPARNLGRGGVLRRGASLSEPVGRSGHRGGRPRGVAGVRHRCAAHPGGRQRTRGRPRRGARGAARVPRGGPGRGPDTRAERAGVAADVVQGCRGGGVPVE